MPGPSLATLAGRRDRALAKYEEAHRAVLDRVLAEAEAGGNVKALAEEAGIARATVYNELARREERRAALGPQDPPPDPAPADVDVDDLSPVMVEVLDELAAGGNPITNGRAGARRTIEALRRRRLVKADEVGLTELGELVVKGGRVHA